MRAGNGPLRELGVIGWRRLWPMTRNWSGFAVARNTLSLALGPPPADPALVCQEVITPPPAGTVKGVPDETVVVTSMVEGGQLLGSALFETCPTVVAAVAGCTIASATPRASSITERFRSICRVRLTWIPPVLSLGTPPRAAPST